VPCLAARWKIFLVTLAFFLVLTRVLSFSVRKGKCTSGNIPLVCSHLLALQRVSRRRHYRALNSHNHGTAHAGIYKGYGDLKGYKKLVIAIIKRKYQMLSHELYGIAKLSKLIDLFLLLTRIHSVERCICPIAVLNLTN